MPNRIKQFHLSPQQVAQGFDASSPPGVLVQGIPEGFRVEYCDFDSEAQMFRFIASHESFPEVPEGEPAGELHVSLALIE